MSDDHGPAARPRSGQLTFVAPRRAKPPRHLADLSAADRRDAVAALGEKAFRARQLSVHYFDRLVDDPAAMTDLPAASRDRLAADLLPPLLTPVRTLDCDGGATVKTVWRLFDGALVESVLMRYPRRATVCVSSQAGCGMNCPFCATGQAGLTRNLSTAEIVEQVLAAARLLAGGGRPLGPPGVPDAAGVPGATTADTLGLGDETGDDGPDRGPDPHAAPAARVSNVVFMGMGEPLANYRAVVDAVRRLIDPRPDGFGMSARGVTVSTVGLVPAIDRLAGEGLPVTLALSLHAPDDGLRDELVPVNTRFTVDAGPGRRPALLRHDRAPGEHRVRAHPGRQRPHLAGRPARHACSTVVAGAGSTSTRSRSTRPPARGGRRATRRSRTSSSRGCAPTASRRRSVTRAGGRSTGRAGSSPRPRAEPRPRDRRHAANAVTRRADTPAPADHVHPNGGASAGPAHSRRPRR